MLVTPVEAGELAYEAENHRDCEKRYQERAGAESQMLGKPSFKSVEDPEVGTSLPPTLTASPT